ncbi:MAG TPA: sigma-70 family RNA polymerase sigma factor [Thermoanaerobaculia bacterium]|nr:sigma-70 family RNA polymerase sigma factor [Thermoanaerobaculia bacterium]
MATDDRDVVARFLRGEREAVGTVDGWIARAAWPYQRRLADRWDDVLQDVRLEVTRLLGQGKFRGESSLRTYLWRVVSHTCLDQLRAQSKWKWADLETLETADGANGLGHVQPVNREDRDLLMRVLERVSHECREMWRLIVAGLSYKEMSLRMNVAEGTLRVRVLRCREKATALRQDLLGGQPSEGRNTMVKKSPNKSGRAKTNDL